MEQIYARLKMSENDYKKIEKSKLPIIYRLILKLPNLSLDSFPDYFSGIFWAIIIPIFLTAEIFLSIFLLVFFPFPINFISFSVIPAVVFLIFVKIMLTRLINWWNATFGEPFKWDVEKATEEYIAVLCKQKSKKNKD
jgi:hypothetical protein